MVGEVWPLVMVLMEGITEAEWLFRVGLWP